jgi:nitrate reductase NapAB chaperone NapD
MNFSGILVTAAIDQVDRVAGLIASIEGMTVDRVDHAGGRIVVVQEAADIGAEIAGFTRIRALPQVLAADLVCHYFGEQPVAEPNTESTVASLGMPDIRREAD